jgi:Protein of unknown function (DUF3313)
MMRKQYIVSTNLLSAGLVVLFLAGCVMSPPPKSGFLGDYSKLHPDKYGKKSLLWWEKDGFEWTRYKKLMIDPVAVYYHPEAKYREIRPDELKELTDYARNTVIEELQPDIPVVDGPGPDVLRVRMAITDIVPASPIINIISLAAIQVPLDMGGAAIEAEFFDSVSHERVAAMVEKKLGNPVFFWRSVTELGYTKGTFKSWAGELKDALKTNP